MKNLISTLAIFTIILTFSAITFGQALTGSIEGTVTDPAGAVIPGATVRAESTGTTTAFNQTVTTDEKGYYVFPQVAPGKYEVTASSTGFNTDRRDATVVLDKAVQLHFNLSVGGSTNTTIVIEENSRVDPTESKNDTNITKEISEKLPKEPTFTSLLKIAPNLRQEPLAGGFQIDGGSGSDNTFFVNGQEVTNFRTGTLDVNNDLSFAIVREVQVKSTGIDAEFAGSLGGVVNGVTFGGTKDWHGNFGVSFEPDWLQAEPNPVLIRFGSGTGQFEYFQPNKDKGTNYFPVASLSGPVLKDKVWGLFTYAPQIFRTQRTIDYYNTSNPNRSVLTSQTYESTIKGEQAFARIDAEPFSKLRVFGSFLWNPFVIDGELPAQTLFVGNPFLTPNDFARRGGRINSNMANGQAIFTPLDWMVLTFRAGRSFLNEKPSAYGANAGTRFGVSTGSTFDPCSVIPGRTTECRGFNTGDNSVTNYDVSTRTTFDADAGFIGINALGRHHIKGGVQFSELYNNVDSGYVSSGYVLLYYGRNISEFTGLPSLPFCDFNNIPTGGNTCTLGTARILRIGTFGEARSKNTALFIQDSWTIKDRLTFNIGIRAENETVPNYSDDPNAREINFGWGDKIAPRFGVAFDVLGDGRTKIFGSYGWHYDRFKYELPRNQFGGQIFLDAFAQITPGRGLSPFDYTLQAMLGGRGIVRGGECPIQNPMGYVECEFDRFVPVNQFIVIPFDPIDPDLKPTRQSEYTFGIEHEFGSNFVLAGRYTHKQLDEVVEDIGTLNDQGSEVYVIGNPGRGFACQVSAGILPCPAAERKYDAFEISIDKRSARYFFNANYTYSRLFGNYSGLASSDEFGRNAPNTGRYFDLPFLGFNADGVPDNGRLATDRPHVFKAYGGYSLDWFGNGINTTQFSAFTTVQSGTPLTTIYPLYSVNTSVLFERGDLGRTETYTETDFAVRHSYNFGSDRRFSIEPFVVILNLFNEQNEIARNTTIGTNITAFQLQAGGCMTCSDQVSVFNTIFNGGGIRQFVLNYYNANPNTRINTYNLPNAFQPSRSVRFGFDFRF